MTITGKASEKKKILDWVYDHGYITSYCGPEVSWGRTTIADTYKVVAHKEMDDGEEEEE